MLIEENEIEYYSSELITKAGPGQFNHGFLSRKSGLKPMPFSGNDEDIDNAFIKRFGFSHWEVFRIKQVHQSDVLLVDESTAKAEDFSASEGDAIITASAEVAIGVLTADCLPIIIVDPIKKAIGMAHAGWRGTVGRIASKTVRRMTEEFASDPKELLAALGPHIKSCCYTVGSDVADNFKATFGDATKSVVNGDTTAVDLGAANTEELVSAGLAEENISNEAPCTSCRTDLFYSFRREGKSAGRQLSFVRINSE